MANPNSNFLLAGIGAKFNASNSSKEDSQASAVETEQDLASARLSVRANLEGFYVAAYTCSVLLINIQLIKDPYHLDLLADLKEPMFEVFGNFFRSTDHVLNEFHSTVLRHRTPLLSKETKKRLFVCVYELRREIMKIRETLFQFRENPGAYVTEMLDVLQSSLEKMATPILESVLRDCT